MRCATNLVDACLRDDMGVLYALTKQVYGLCEYGVLDPNALFYEYCHLVTMLMQKKKRGDVVRILDALVWAPSQTRLASLLGITPQKWSSILTVKTPYILF